MIADDDRLIRDSLSRLIDWSTVGVEVVASVSDGDEAYRLLNELKPDILLTDIEMPGFSGIGLLKHIRDAKLACRVIFLSAYASFSYAQDAVRFGAYSYLIKPVDETQLLSTVAACCREILATQNDQDILWQSHLLREASLKNSLKALLISDDKTTQPEDAIARLLHLHHGCAAAVLIKSQPLPTEDTLPPSPSIPELQSFYLPLSASEAILLWIAPGVAHEALQRGIPEQLCALKDACNVDLHAGASCVHPCRDILKLYPECSFAILLPHFNPKSQAIFGNALCYEHGKDDPLGVNLVQRLKEGSIPIEDMLQSLFITFLENNTLYDIQKVKLMCISFLDGFGQTQNPFTCSPAEWTTDFMFTFKRSILACRDYEQLYTEMSRILHCLFDAVDCAMPKSQAVRDLIQYIHDFYPTASLADAASRLFLSPSYLSRLFAADMNESFSRYLMRYRVSIAKEQMKNPNAKMYEIALSVGYSDLAHFSKAFKLIEGIAPGKYREKQGRL